MPRRKLLNTGGSYCIERKTTDQPKQEGKQSTNGQTSIRAQSWLAHGSSTAPAQRAAQSQAVAARQKHNANTNYHHRH